MDQGYLITILIVAVGLLAGYILGRVAKKEVKQGQYYLTLLQKALFTIIVGLVMYEYRSTFHFIWAGALLIFLYYMFHERICPTIIYAFYGVLAYLSYDYFLPLAGTQLLYGLVTGSICTKKWKILLASGIIYLIIAGILILAL
jgi:hypothetical protein